MLEIKNISKTYRTGDLVQKALDNVSLNLRDNEFVAILGPSGSGKTTLLNIIGGLDKYDNGDLIINNVSTNNYKDKDWDSYRNHTIGFIFQSYNLIPHQTLLANVELALTISGIGKKERKQRALDALEKVGLKEQAHKKPNQLSGGQMQRVAIARALVNNPAIVLADEPTGALDTKTSIQVMELLKEVAKDRLVVMVTHNPELAQQYASRIVNLKDGVILDDSDPYINTSDEENIVKKRLGKAHMSVFTALSLSFNNLLSKKARTILIAFAGSIGIIGIALILALSTGFQNYVDSIQEDTMSSYPLSIQQETANIFGALLSSRMESDSEVEEGKVEEQMMISNMMNSVGSNDLKSFIKYLNENEDLYKDDVKKIDYSYSVSPRIYTKDVTDSIVQLNPNTLMSSIYSDSAASLLSSVSSSSSMGTFAQYDSETLKESCTLLAGDWSNNYDEVMIVLSDKSHISDLLVYSLGLRDNSELKTLISQVMSGEEVTINNEAKTFTYEDLMDVELKLVDVSDLYKYNSEYDTYEDMSSDDQYMEDIYTNAATLKITGIAYCDDDTKSIAGVIYSPDLVTYVMDKAKDSEIVKKQLANKDVDVFSGNRFDEENDNKSSLDFNNMISVDQDKLANAFNFNLDTSTVQDTDYASIIKDNSEDIKENIIDVTNTFADVLTKMDKQLATTLLSQTVAGMTQTVYSANGCDDGYVDAGIMGGCQAIGGGTTGGSGEQIPSTSPDSSGQGETGGQVDGEPESSQEPTESVEPTATPTVDPQPTDTPSSTLACDLTNLSAIPFCYSTDKGYSENKYVVIPDNFKTLLSTTLNTQLDGAIETMVTQLKDSASISTSKDNIKKVINEVINIYIDKLDALDADMTIPNVGKLVAVDKVNSISIDDIANNVLSTSENSSMIYGDAYDSASEYMSLLAMQGVASAVQDSITPFTDLMSGMEDAVSIDTNAFASAFNFNLDQDELSRLMSSMLTSSTASYSNNLINLGYQDMDEPTSISIYFNDFDSKDHFLDLIDNYNNSVEEEKQITYTDITGLLMSSVQTIINAVTYVLIAFVSISLVVSSIMIAVITLISVMERTKEIGILRAMGASKGNVRNIFNAETFIIGLLSGCIGVGISYLLTFPINDIIYKLTNIDNIKAVVEPQAAIILILISVFLTMFAGYIPSRKASKQDPVTALRSE